jgi:ribonucleoside-diphosphate reductase alpha chain
VKHLRAIRCPSIAWDSGHAVLSCADAIGSVLEKQLKGDEKGGDEHHQNPVDYGLARNVAGQCPECGSLLIYQEGCHLCPFCGYTKC